MPVRLTQEEFVKLLSINNKDIEVVGEYIKSKVKIEFKCLKCNKNWFATPSSILSGHGCYVCSKNKEKLTKEYFVNRANEIHNNKYDYSKFLYVNVKTKGEVICKYHGSFLQKPGDHLYRKAGCPKCKAEKQTERNRLTQDEVIDRFIKIHGDRYDYSKFKFTDIYGYSVIICQKHGEFLQNTASHLQGNGCKKCNNSKGENKIVLLLNQLGVDFIQQANFDGCRNKKILPFDFYLPSFNTCIEYDGIQHFRGWWKHPTSENRNEFRNIKIRDNIKTKFCQENNIRLIRIKYTDFNKIEEILRRELNLK